MTKKVAGKRFIFGPSSINHFPYTISFSLELSLKKLCTLGHMRRRTISSADAGESRIVVDLRSISKYTERVIFFDLKNHVALHHFCILVHRIQI